MPWLDTTYRRKFILSYSSRVQDGRGVTAADGQSRKPADHIFVHTGKREWTGSGQCYKLPSPALYDVLPLARLHVLKIPQHPRTEPPIGDEPMGTFLIQTIIKCPQFNFMSFLNVIFQTVDMHLFRFLIFPICKSQNWKHSWELHEKRQL